MFYCLSGTTYKCDEYRGLPALSTPRPTPRHVTALHFRSRHIKNFRRYVHEQNERFSLAHSRRSELSLPECKVSRYEVKLFDRFEFIFNIT